MRTSWLIAIAASAAIGASAPTELLAQGNSNRGRQQQQQQRQEAREQSRRQAERAQLQRQREQQRRQQATQVRVRRDDDRYRRDDRDRRYDDRWDDRRYDDRWNDRRSNSRYDERYDRRGPAFCRSGEGHPVFGRQWCRDKGYGLGRERSRDIWGDIIYRQPRDRRDDGRRLGRGTLGDILGSVVLGRFDQYGRTYYGGQGDLSGRWFDDRSIMQLYIGSIPFARLIDRDRDGRVDDVILAR